MPTVTGTRHVRGKARRFSDIPPTLHAISPPPQSESATSYYPSSCNSSLSSPRLVTYRSPPRNHLEKLIKEHGPPSPVSSTSSLRRFISTSPISSALPPSFIDSPPASPPTAVDTSAIDPSSYASASGSRPIPIPRAPSNRSLDDCPITPLTGRFEQGLYISQADRSSHRSTADSRSTDPKRKTKKKSKSISSGGGTSPPPHARRTQTNRPIYALGPPVSNMSTHAGHSRSSPQRSSKPTPFQLNNLPRFHPAVYQSPNDTTKEALPLSPRSHGYRAASDPSRDALREYRELIAGVAPLHSVASGTASKPRKPRLDPLGSPGPVTPLTLEEADEYLSAKSNETDDDRIFTDDGATVIGERRHRLSVSEKDRYKSHRHKDSKRRS